MLLVCQHGPVYIFQDSQIFLSHMLLYIRQSDFVLHNAQCKLNLINID